MCECRWPRIQWVHYDGCARLIRLTVKLLVVHFHMIQSETDPLEWTFHPLVNGPFIQRETSVAQHEWVTGSDKPTTSEQMQHYHLRLYGFIMATTCLESYDSVPVQFVRKLLLQK